MTKRIELYTRLADLSKEVSDLDTQIKAALLRQADIRNEIIQIGLELQRLK